MSHAVVLDHEDWSSARFSAVLKLPQLPVRPAAKAAPHAEGARTAAGAGAATVMPPKAPERDVAAAADVGDACLPSETLPQQPRTGAAFLTTRPKRKAGFVAGAPISAAIVREVEDLRRAREEASELAAVLSGGQASARGLTPRTQPTSGPPPPTISAPPASARGPNRRRTKAAASAASLQDAASHSVGINKLERTAVSLPSAPPARLGFTHAEPQPQQSPHVAQFAMDAMALHLPVSATSTGHDGWSGRSLLRGGKEMTHSGLVHGPKALVMGEVEQILREMGVTADLMADAGLSVQESERLLQGLYVHSTGFLQMLTDSFEGLPHRRTLLKHVWAGFTMLLERAQAGDESLGYRSVLAAQLRDSKEAYANLEQAGSSASSQLKDELARARALGEEQLQLRENESRRANEGEALAARMAHECADLRSSLANIEGKLQTAIEHRQKIEANLVEEQQKVTSLQVKTQQLSSAKAEVGRLLTVAGRVTSERDSALEAVQRTDKLRAAAEATSHALAREFELIDAEITTALQALSSGRSTREVLEAQLREERVRLDAIQERAAAAEVTHKERLAELKAQLKNADAGALHDQQQREAAEKRSRQLEEQVRDASESATAQAEQLAAKAREIRELNSVVAEKDTVIQDAQMEAERQTRIAEAAVAEKEQARKETAAVQKETRRLIDEARGLRDSAKASKNELDQYKVRTMRDGDGARSDLLKVTGERDAALAECEQIKESFETAQEHIGQLEEDLTQQRKKYADRELEHQKALVAQEKQLRAERIANSQERAVHEQRATQDAITLKETLEQVAALQAAVNAIPEEVIRLTSDNGTYEMQIESYENALAGIHELRSTCSVAQITADVVAEAVARPVAEQLALHSEQQRCIDITEQDLRAVLQNLEHCTDFLAEELQPIIDAAAEAMHDAPILKEDLTKAGLKHSETMMQLRLVRDAADDERQRHLIEMAAVQQKAIKDAEEAASTADSQASKLTQLTQDLNLAMEELEGWRRGSIRLANAKNWRPAQAA